MAIVSVKEQWAGRKARFGNNWQRSYSRVFQVRTDDNTDGQITVAFAAGIPRVGDFFTSPLYGEWDALALCHEVTPEQDDADPRLWKVTCEFQTQTGQAPPTLTGGVPIADSTKPGAGGGGDNPTLRPPEVEWDLEVLRLPLVKAFTNKGGVGAVRTVPVQNSAGQKFDPFPEYEVAYPVFKLTRYEAVFDAAKARKYSFAVNADPFMGADPGQAQCMPIRGKLEYVGQTPFWRVSYAIRFTPDGVDSWQPEILDAGRKEIGPGPGYKLTPIFDDTTKQPVNEDWPLNSFGVVRSDADVVAGNVFWLTFHTYRMLPFSALLLE